MMQTEKFLMDPFDRRPWSTDPDLLSNILKTALLFMSTYGYGPRFFYLCNPLLSALLSSRIHYSFFNGCLFQLQVEREIAIMKLINHPNILGLYDVYENRKNL